MISVVIPLYNKAPYILRALDSVARQTWQPDEVLVVDDGSTDGGGELAARFPLQGLRILRQANAGVSAARNLGVENARQPWVAFLDADDEWEPRFLECMEQAALQWPDSNAVFANFWAMPACHIARSPASGPCRKLTDYFRFCLRNDGGGMWSSAVMVRKTILEAIGGFPCGVAQGEDVDTWFRLGCAGPIVYVPEPLARYHTGLGICAHHPVDSDIWRTYGRLVATQAIPRKLQSSAGLLATEQRLRHIGSLLQFGDRVEAQRKLADIPWQYRWRSCWWCYWGALQWPGVSQRFWLRLKRLHQSVYRWTHPLR
jgi:hypothetical protein